MPEPQSIGAITELGDDDVRALVLELGGRPFHHKQLLTWLYGRCARDYATCTDLPRSLRLSLEQRLPMLSSHIATAVTAADGTSKLLIRLADGETVESVLIPDRDRMTLCISTQVGCPVGCVFCASGLDGVRRNLSKGEIVEQVLHARHLLATSGSGSLTHLVVMGIGEPMLNLHNLLPALERIHDRQGIDLGARRITVSTSGYPDRIRKFADAGHAFNLAISLHAADDALRRELVPTATVPVAELIGAGRYYFERTGREVTFEVVLLAGRNDRAADADLLARRLRGLTCTVNLLPWNPVAQIPNLRRPDAGHTDRFAERLRDAGVNVTVRRQRGADQNAACGQLRIDALA